MKRIVCILFSLALLCGCAANGDDSSAPDTSTSSRYIDADTDFTGKITIVGRWHCISETQNGEARDASADGIYYIFSSDGTMDSFYDGTEMIDYTGYIYKGDSVTMQYSGGAITLNCVIEETRLTLCTADGAIETVYERVDYE